LRESEDIDFLNGSKTSGGWSLRGSRGGQAENMNGESKTPETVMNLKLSWLEQHIP